MDSHVAVQCSENGSRLYGLSLFSRCGLCNLHHRCVHGHVLQHDHRLGCLLLLRIIQLRIALDQMWQQLEHGIGGLELWLASTVADLMHLSFVRLVYASGHRHQFNQHNVSS